MAQCHRHRRLTLNRRKVALNAKLLVVSKGASTISLLSIASFNVNSIYPGNTFPCIFRVV